MSTRPRWWILAAAMLAAALAQAASARDDDTAKIAGLEALRAQDLRVATIFFRLATSAVDLCAARAPQAGIVLHDAQQYGTGMRPIAVRHFRFGEGPSISAVVPGSPAASAGLQPDDALAAINGAEIGSAGAVGSRRGSYDGVAGAMASLNHALARGSATLTVRRGSTRFDISLQPATGCASEAQLIPASRLNAAADGRYVQVTSAIVDYVASDDELAVVIGHELAHNILGHRVRLDAAGVPGGLLRRFGRNAAKVRETEVEADRLGLHLVARAGYDIEAAPAFWRRFGKEHGPGIFADATHPGWRKREAALRETIAAIRARPAE
jgi:beta-barrel assembly-enhancing protease